MKFVPKPAWLLGLSLLLLWGCQGDSKNADGQRGPTKTDGRAAAGTIVDEGPAANDLDVSFVTPDAFAAVVVFPEQLLGQSWAEGEGVQEGIAKLIESAGFDPRQCQRMLIIVSPPQDDQSLPLMGRMEFATPLDLAAIAAQHADALLVSEDEGQTYYTTTDGTMAYHAAADGSVLFGSPDKLKAITQSKVPTGALAKRLRNTELSGDAMVLVDFTPIRPLMLEAVAQAGDQLPAAGENADFTPKELIENIVSLELRIDTAAKEIMTGKVDLGDAEMAKQLASAFKKQIGQVKVVGPLALSAMLKGTPDEVNTSVTTLMYGALNGLKIAADGSAVAANITLPDDALDHVEVLLRYAEVLRKQAEREQNLATVGEALARAFEADSGFPTPTDHPDWFDDNGRLKLSWRVHLLPALGEEELFAEFRPDEAWDSEHNQALLAKIPSVYRAAPDATETSILALAGSGMAMQGGRPCAKESLTDDRSLTLLLLDAAAGRQVPWTQPIDFDELSVEQLAELGNPERPTLSVVTSDGQKRELKNGLSPENLAGLLSVAGEEEVPQSVFMRMEMPLGNGFGPGGPPTGF